MPEGCPPSLQQQVLQFLKTRRLAGYDLEVLGPKYVPVELAIQVSIVPGAQRGDVEQALLKAFGSFFNPDNFTFGGNLYISRIYAAAMATPGVAAVEITRLARLHAARPDRENGGQPGERLSRGRH